MKKMRVLSGQRVKRRTGPPNSKAINILRFPKVGFIKTLKDCCIHKSSLDTSSMLLICIYERCDEEITCPSISLSLASQGRGVQSEKGGFELVTAFS